MDITTLAGLALALGMVLVPFLGGMETESLSVSLFFVLGGTLGATILSVPRKTLVRALKSLLVAFSEHRQTAKDLVVRIVTLSDVARREGVLALESSLKKEDDEFLRSALEMAVDGTEPESLENTLSHEANETRSRHESGKLVLELIARYAPAYGMLGTLTALIHMLTRWSGDLASSDQMLSRMGFALGTTFCGIFLANTIALPLADKLAEKDRDELLLKRIVIHGVLAIQSGDSPRTVRNKLNIFLSPEERLA